LQQLFYHQTEIFSLGHSQHEVLDASGEELVVADDLPHMLMLVLMVLSLLVLVLLQANLLCYFM
jgi:hypothetical protein